MSKRFIYPQQNGDRKKAKLDISISDHNFPLSQNPGPSKESNHPDTWGDDNDDEIFLLASQVCEQAYNSNTSQLPDYSLCMQPGTTSTQYEPSTSKAAFNFKKPNAIPSNIVSTNLRDKCSRISSPLPGIASKTTAKMRDANPSDELIFSDKVYQGDADYVYRQLLQLQEDNAKLKSENGKLLEKCVTKEGESSILRTQLKSCQTAVDNARLERIKAQEKVQMEWTEKLTALNGQMHDLRTQLDFKNLEIISIKEKCKLLESNKIKLTQVTIANNDISSSHRNHLSMNESLAPMTKRVKTISNAVQTDDKAPFIKLYKSYRTEQTKLSSILQHLLQPTTEHDSLLEYNDKLQKHTDQSQNKCRIYNTFHRVPSTPVTGRDTKCKVDLSDVYEELTFIASGEDAFTRERFSKVLTSIKMVLQDVQSDLQAISHKMTTAFQKEMDEKYIETTNTYHVIHETDLISGKALYKEEQSIAARRMLGILSHLLPHANIDARTFGRLDDETSSEGRPKLVNVLNRICGLVDSTSCAVHYSGLLLPMISCIAHLQKYTDKTTTLEIIKHMISARPLLAVSCAVLELMRNVDADVVNNLCPQVNGGNLKLDYDQGVLLYKKDSCYIQVLLKQVEAALKCIEKQSLTQQAVMVAQSLVAFYARFNDGTCGFNQDKVKCDCHLVLMQVLVYALRICAATLDKINSNVGGESKTTELLAVCRSGTQILHQCALRDVELSSQLGYYEGHLMQFCEILKTWDCSEVYSNMLSEISGTFQSSPEDMTSSFNKQPWLKNFDNFSIVD